MDYIKKFMEDNGLDTDHLYIIDEIANYPFNFIKDSNGKMNFAMSNVGFDVKMEILTGILNGTCKVKEFNEIYRQVIEDVLQLKLGNSIITMKDGEILKKNLKGINNEVPCEYIVKSDGLYYCNDNGDMVNSYGVLGKIISGEYTYKLI